LNEIVPEASNQPYDIREVINHVVDDGYFFEVQELFAPNICVGFARLGGRAVGLHDAVETAIGLVIIALALRLLARSRLGELRFHAHAHVHGARTRRGAFAIGLVHSVGGSTGVSVLVLASVHSTGLAVVSLARRMKINPEDALRVAGQRFRRRFAETEASLRRDGVEFRDLDPAAIAKRWEETR